MIIGKRKMFDIKRYKPKFDKLYFWITVPTLAIVLGALVLTGVIHAIGGTIVMAATLLFTAYFLISPCFGYVDLRQTSVFVRFGFFLTREIPYEKIRGVEKKRTVIADSMLSLKNAMEHVNIKHGSFDVTSVSVKDNDALMTEIRVICGISE